jgi:hypothetical protein
MYMYMYMYLYMYLSVNLLSEAIAWLVGTTWVLTEPILCFPFEPDYQGMESYLKVIASQDCMTV